MAEYIEREAAIAWFMPYVYEGKSIEADVVISDLKGMKAADVEPVKHGRWGKVYRSKVTVTDGYVSTCCDMWNERKSHFCPNFGAKMDGGDDNAAD